MERIKCSALVLTVSCTRLSRNLPRCLITTLPSPLRHRDAAISTLKAQHPASAQPRYW